VNFYKLTDIKVFRNLIENNLALQQRLYELRSETKEAFDEAKRLEARWKELEKEQKEVYQVR
jgi:ESCRT-I complex subunit VPS37